MANNIIKTRILLRNDTLANWNNSTVVLDAGEVAIATLDGGKLAEVRVGTGSSTWASALKLNVTADQISGLVETIRGTAKKYQVVANGENGNSWKLQEAALSGGAWSDVADSTWTVDFSSITTDIGVLSTAIDALSGVIDETRATLNTVSSDYLTSADKTELSNAITALDNAKLAKAEFAALSVEVGLDAANANNKVVTQKDIEDLTGAMHFRGAVTPNEGETDLEALARAITNPAAGDVAIITTTSKEYVYAGEGWIELGDEVLYATKAQVATDIAAAKSETFTSAVASANSYTDTLVAEVSATTLNTAKSYTDTQIQALDVSATENGNADPGFVTVVTEADGKVSVTKKTVQLSDITDYSATISAYALSADVSALVSNVSADTIDTVVGEAADLSSADTVNGAKAYAKNYADAKVDELSSGFLIFDCGHASLREGEPAAPFSA